MNQHTLSVPFGCGLYGTMRITALVVTFFFAWLLPLRFNWDSIFWAFLFCHYLFAFTYARRRLHILSSSRYGIFLLLIFAVVSIGGYCLPFPDSAAFYFGVHHALTEVYGIDYVYREAGIDKDAPHRSSLLRCVHFALHLSLFNFLNRGRFPMCLVHPNLLLALAAISAALYFVSLARVRSAYRPELLLDLAVPEIIGCAIVLFSWQQGWNLDWGRIGFYHLTVWLFAPIPHLIHAADGSMPRYLGWTIMVCMGFYLISPAALATVGWTPRKFDILWYNGLWPQEMLRWAHIHITFSFLLSDVNPDWILRRIAPHARAH